MRGGGCPVELQNNTMLSFSFTVVSLDIYSNDGGTKCWKKCDNIAIKSDRALLQFLMSKDVNVANKEQLKSVIEKYSFHNQSRQQSSKIETVNEKFLLKNKNFISVK